MLTISEDCCSSVCQDPTSDLSSHDVLPGLMMKMISLQLPTSPLIVANITQHSPAETCPLEDSSISTVFTVSSLHRYFLFPLAAAGYRETIYKFRTILNCFLFFSSTHTWGTSCSAWSPHKFCFFWSILCRLLSHLEENINIIDGVSIGFSYICYTLSNNSGSHQTHCKTCSPRRRCLCSKPDIML